MAKTVTRVARLLDRALGRALLDPEDPTALGLVRIAVVAVLTLSLLTHAGSFAFYFSELSPLHGEYARMAFPSRFSLFFFVENPLAVQAIFVVGIVAHVLWMVGRWTTPASFVAWLVWVSMVGRNPLLYSLPDQLQMAMATWLVCMPSGRGLSLDARRRGAKPVPVWCRRVIIVQLAAMYTSTGLLKHGKTWHADGTALYYALSNPYNRHFDVPELLAALQPWVLRPMTWLVLAFEIGFAAFVLVHALRELLGRPRWVPDLRPIVLGFGVLMHLGIQSMMYVAWFSPLVLATYLAFLRPDEAQRFVRWITARRSRRPG